MNRFVHHLRLLSIYLPLLAANAFAAGDSKLTRSNTLVIEPEQFTVLGPWRKDGGLIRSTGKPGVALGGFRVAEAGEYHVWTLSRDFTKSQPGSRRFRIKVDDTASARDLGGHKHNGWYWEEAAVVTLSAGEHILYIEDISLPYARVDAVLLTTAAVDPNTLAESAKGSNAFRTAFQTPVIQPQRIYTGTRVPEAAPTTTTNAAPLATLSNADVTITFRAARSTDGSSRICREVALGGAIIPMGMESLLVLSNVKNSRQSQGPDDYHPGWEAATPSSWQLAGQVIAPPADFKDPYTSGILHRLNPVSIVTTSPRLATITYRETTPVDSAPLEATIVWTLPEKGYATSLEATLKAPETAFYSFAFGAGQPVLAKDVFACQLPPLFQFHRLVETPFMIVSAITPHPLALIETKTGPVDSSRASTSVTTGVIATGNSLIPQVPVKNTPDAPLNWANRDNSAFGFTLSSPDGKVQPVVFCPILGFADSRVEKGALLRRTWWTITAPKDWAGAMREADLSIFALRDYREPITTSLTDQALNIIDLMHDDKASGWNVPLKAPLNIEGNNLVTHASPLTWFSAARLTRDEDFFRRRALPTLEYMLSRSGSHFSLGSDENGYANAQTSRLQFKHSNFSASVWWGLDDMLGTGNNSWLLQDPESSPTDIIGRSIPSWSDKLARYRVTPTPALLEKIRTEADQWIQSVFDPAQNQNAGVGPFYNSKNFYPYWWDLLDLYEITNDTRYRDAARQGAELTVAGLFVTPALPDPSSTTTLYPGGKVGGTYHAWYLPDGTVGRLGWPKSESRVKSGNWIKASFPMAEKKVPDWVASPVGLGFEQPITYVRAANNYSNIQLSVWAANLLRLSGATGDDYWRTFARNALIGRGASYPGYYLADYIDLMQSPEYTVTGPDMTSFYWHHIPVHLAMVLDYLFTDADVRTHGAVRFPYVKQQGYAWFSSRIYGGRPGRVLDDNAAWPWLDRKAFHVETPKADYIGARSREKFHLIVLNQAQSEITAPITISPDAIGLRSATPLTARLHAADGTESTVTFSENGRYSLALPKGGWAVFTFAATPSDFWPQSTPLPADAKPLQQALGSPWGDLHAYRTRTPFGKDALYFVLSGHPANGAKMELLLENDTESSRSVDRYPYELSVYPWSASQPAAFRLRLTSLNGKSTTTPVYRLTGGQSSTN